MKRPLSVRWAVAQLLTAMGLSAILPLSASAQTACWGPYPTVDAAREGCGHLLNSGYCSRHYFEIFGYTDWDGSYVQACCCIPLVATVPQEDEGVEPNQEQDERSEE